MNNKVSKCRILIFNPFYPPHIGGLESHADEFNFHLGKLGYKLTVFTPQIPEKSSLIENRYAGVTIIRFPAVEIIPNYPIPAFWKKEFWSQYNLIHNSEYDLVISRTRFFLTSIMALLYSKIKNKKWIHIEHGSDYVNLSNKITTGIAWIYDETFGRLVFKSSDINVSVSKAVQDFVGQFDNRTSPLIYRGLNFSAINNIRPNVSIRKKYPDKYVACFAGRLFKWKGLENSIKAFSLLPDNIYKKWIFVIIGRGEDFKSLQKQAASNVIFLGEKSWEVTISYLKTSDIYLHSSLSGGGLSTSLLEAIYCGCNIIATRGEGATEVVNSNNGILIDSYSVEGLKLGISKLLSKPKISSSLDVRKRLIRKSFSWSKNILKYHNLIQNLI
ncbi:MAG: glycosyltransferase family 4 protein [Desulfobacteraceae bacterium]|jgi:glycosyltransferase involved in cell wall biosynthesis